MSESLILAQAVQALQRRIDRLERKEVLVGLPNLTRGTVTLNNGDNHDVAIGAATYITITGPTGAYAITGLTGGVDGRILFLRNTTTQEMTIRHLNTSSAMGNRISNPNAGNVMVGTRTRVILIYDSFNAQWFLFSASGSTGAA
jgi:hypothetical protein